MKLLTKKELGSWYDHKTHTYYIDGEPVVSVTKFMESYLSPFDKSKLLPIIAKAQKVSQAKLSKIWKAKGDKGRGFGDYIHSTAELYYLVQEEIEEGIANETEGPHAVVVKNLMDSILSKYDIIEMEDPKTSYLYRMGYTPDIVLRRRSDGVIVIADFKTTKFTTPESYKDVKGTLPKLMKGPYRDLKLREVPLHKAAVQLSLYAILLAADKAITYIDTEMLELVERKVFHVPQNPKAYGGKGYKVFNLPNIDNATYKVLQSAISEGPELSEEELSADW